MLKQCTYILMRLLYIYLIQDSTANYILNNTNHNNKNDLEERLQIEHLNHMQEMLVNMDNRGNLRSDHIYLGPRPPDIGVIRIVKMMEEIVRDCQMKESELDSIKNIYQGNSPFEVGYVMCQILENYKYMILIYRNTQEKPDSQTTIDRLVKSLKKFEHIASETANMALMVSTAEMPKKDTRLRNITRAGLRGEKDRRKLEEQRKRQNEIEYKKNLAKKNYVEKSKCLETDFEKNVSYIFSIYTNIT